METKTIEELLLELLQDMAVVKAKLDSLNEIKLNVKGMDARLDKLEAQNERHEKQLASLENRASTMEQFVRNNINDAKKQQSSVFISMGLAVFSAICSIIVNLF